MLKITALDVYHGYLQAVKKLSLHVKEGELLAILGANGAGKSSLLGTIAGLFKPSDGDIVYKGRSIAGKSPESLVPQGISLVPESREIFNSLTVLDNLLLGAYHRYRSHKQAVYDDVNNILSIFQELKGREKQLAGTLSGGLQQMLAIGRGLMAQPRLLLLDEPSIGLAPMIVREIMSVLDQLKNTGVTIILVEQNTKAALKVADRAIVMERGQITHCGSTDIMEDSRLQQAYLGRARTETGLAL